MAYTARQLEAALVQTMRIVREEIRESWAMEAEREQREALWSEHKAVDRIEERIRNEFGNIIQRAAGTVADREPGE